MVVQSVVDSVKRSLATQMAPMAWRRVTVPGLDVPWVGVDVPVIDTGGRPWVWEVVTPDTYDDSDRMQNDPLVLPVAQDLIVAEVHHQRLGQPLARMQTPVSVMPRHLTVQPAPDPDGPWSIHLRTGWTIESLGAAAQSWIDRETKGSASLSLPARQPAPSARYQLHPAINIESDAFDRLLTLEPDDAAMVTSLFSTIHEALSPFR